MRYVCFFEVIDMSLPPFDGFLEWLDERLTTQTPGPLGGVGLSPHAPYTVSEPLMRVLRGRYHQDQGLPFTMHVGEVRSELSCLAWQSGPLAKLMRRSGLYGPKGETPISRRALDFLRAGRMDGGAVDQLVHGNSLAESERMALARAGNSVLVVCPSTRRWHDQCGPIFTQASRAGLPIALATDSMASNDQLDMVEEMRESLRDGQCQWKAADAFRAATQGGAHALNLSGVVGCLESGYAADFIALDCSMARPKGNQETFNSADSFLNYWLQEQNDLPLCGTWVAGALRYQNSDVIDFEIDSE